MKLKDLLKAMHAIEEDRALSVDIVTSALKEALTKAYRKHVEMPDALVDVVVRLMLDSHPCSFIASKEEKFSNPCV